MGLSQTPTGEEGRGGRLGVFTTFSSTLKGNAGQGMDMASKSQDPAWVNKHTRVQNNMDRHTKDKTKIIIIL